MIKQRAIKKYDAKSFLLHPIAPHRPHMTTKQSVNDALHSGHHRLPSLQKTVLRFKLAVFIASADLSCYYKRSIIDPLGSLMSASPRRGKFPISIPGSE